MSTITTLDVALKAVELADANPEHVYEKDGSGFCTYVHRGEGGVPTGYGCLFGQALTALGVTGIPEGVDIGSALKRLGVTGDADGTLERVLQRAQSEQDRGIPWRAAIAPVKAAIEPVKAELRLMERDAA